MKRIFASILVLTLVLGIPLAGAETIQKSATIEGAIFGGQSGDRIGTLVTFDTDWITTEDNTVYNPKLAAFSALLCADSYYREKDLEKGTQNRVLFDDGSEYDSTSFLKMMGFSDVRRVETFREKEYPLDSNDSATMTMGYRLVDGKFDVFAVVFRGSFSVQERISSFDVGSASEAYEARTGEHPEWDHEEYYKGNGIAANRAEEFLSAFIAQYDHPDLPDCILFTGHSRGAALANIIGANYEKRGEARTYTYAFNSMPVTNDADAGNLRTIFNLYDGGDFYSNALPFGEEIFYRFGSDLTALLDELPDAQARIAEMTGRECAFGLSNEDLEAYASLFAGRFPGRDSLYEDRVSTRIFDSREAAEEHLAACQQMIGAESGLNIAALCEMSEIAETEDGKFAVTMTYCDQALIQSYAYTLAYGRPAGELLVTLFSEDEDGCRIAEFLMEHLDQITNGHLLINTYILSGYIN